MIVIMMLMINLFILLLLHLDQKQCMDKLLELKAAGIVGDQSIAPERPGASVS